MSPRVVVAVVGLAAVGVSEGRAAADGGESVLRLVWFDPSVMAAGSEAVANAEAAALLARMGVATVSWRRATAPELIAKSELWVSSLGAGPEPASDPPVLGATASGHPLASVVWVRVPNVRAAIGLLGDRRPCRFSRRAARTGRALGRVIAHEVVHARVPGLQHGTGLMSSVLTRRQLTSSSLMFDPEVGYALQAALRGGRVPSGARLLTADARVQERDR